MAQKCFQRRPGVGKLQLTNIGTAASQHRTANCSEQHRILRRANNGGIMFPTLKSRQTAASLHWNLRRTNRGGIMLPTMAQSRETAASQHRKLRGSMLWNCIPLGGNARDNQALAHIVTMTLVRLSNFIHLASFIIPIGINKVLLQGKKTDDGK